MNILALFDGLGGAAVSMIEAGLKIDKYYSSEVDKFANAQIKLNFPDVIQLGSVVDVDVSKLDGIDILFGGSPCQSFSFAGKRKGMATKCDIEILSLDQYLDLKKSGFEFEGQSYLFWEYMRILTDLRKINPNIKFLLENVEMGEKWERVLSNAIGINGLHICASLVSAQNRKRIYWTNIGLEPSGLFGDFESVIQQPKDQKLTIKDILQPEEDVDKKYYLSEKMIKYYLENSQKMKEKGIGFSFSTLDIDAKAKCITTREGCRMQNNYIKLNKQLRPKPDQEKISTLTAGGHSGGNHSDMDYICVAMRGRSKNGKTEQQLEPREDEKTNCITTVQKDNLIISGTWRTHKDGQGLRPIANLKVACVPARAREDGSGQNVVIIQRARGYNKGGEVAKNGKIPPLTKSAWEQNNLLHIDFAIRRLTPIECARAQTIPAWYKWACRDTQRYKMIGNGWCIKVIVHILSYYKGE